MSVSDRVVLKEKTNSKNAKEAHQKRLHHQKKQEQTVMELSSKSGDNLVVTDTTVSVSDLAILKDKTNQGEGYHHQQKEKKSSSNTGDNGVGPIDSFLKRYKIMEKIGEGSYSEVLKCQNRVEGTIVACKRLKHIYKSWNDVNNISEIATLRTIERHVNILQMIEIHYDETLGKVSLVFELMDINLYELIKDRKKVLPDHRVKVIMYQLFRALRHLHKLGIFHRDIKPENILIKTKNDDLKLGDLGSVRGMFSRAPYTEYISTRWYRSPECLLTAGHYSHKMDIWAAGCVFYEVLTLRPLFPGSSELDQINRINTILGPPPMKLLDTFHKQAEMERDSYRGQNQLNRRQQIQKVLESYSTATSKKSSRTLKSKAEISFPNPSPSPVKDTTGIGFDKHLSTVSQNAKEIIKACLAYDPELRPTAHRVIHANYFQEERENHAKRGSEKVILKPVITICGESPAETCGPIDLRTLGDNKIRYRRGHQVKASKQPSKQAIPVKKAPTVKPEVKHNYLKNSSSPNENSVASQSQSRSSNIPKPSKLSMNSDARNNNSSAKVARKASDTSSQSPYKAQLVSNYMKKASSNIKPKVNSNFMKSSSSMRMDVNNNYTQSSSNLEKTDGSSGMMSPPARRTLSNAAAEQIRREFHEAQKRSERMRLTKAHPKRDEAPRLSSDDDEDTISMRKNARMEAGDVFKSFRENFSKSSEKVPAKPVVTICGEMSNEPSGKIVLRSFGDKKILYGPAQDTKLSKQSSKPMMSLKQASMSKPETMKNVPASMKPKANNYTKNNSFSVKPEVNNNYMNPSSIKAKVNTNNHIKNSSRTKLELNNSNSYIKSSPHLEKHGSGGGATSTLRYPAPGRRSVSNAAAEQIRKEFRDAQRKRSDRMKSTMRDAIVYSSDDQDVVMSPMRKKGMEDSGFYKPYREGYSKAKSSDTVPCKSRIPLCGGDSPADPGGAVDLRTLGSNKIFYRPGQHSKASKQSSKQLMPTMKPSAIPSNVNNNYMKMKYVSPLKPPEINNFTKDPSSTKLEVRRLYVKNPPTMEKSDGTRNPIHPPGKSSYSNTGNAAVEQIRKEIRDTQRKRQERMKSTMKDEVFCSSDDDVVITMRKKFDSLISERARKLSECLKSNIVSNAGSTEFRKACETDDDLLPQHMASYSRNVGVSDKSKKYARRELRARMAESLTMSNRFASVHWRLPDHLQGGNDPHNVAFLDNNSGGDSVVFSGYNDSSLADQGTTKFTQTVEKVPYQKEDYQKNLKYPQRASSKIYPFSRHDQNNNRHGQIYSPPGNKPVYQSQSPSVGTMIHERKYRYSHNIPVPRISNNSPNHSNSYTNYSTRGKTLKDNPGDLKNRLRPRL